MNQDFRKTEELLEKAGKAVRLSGIEKQKVRSLLEKRMEKPFYMNIQSLFVTRYVVVPILIVVLMGGGVLGVSANSLPGDLLYPMKVDVYEPIVGFTNFNTQEKVKYQENLTKRRLAELVELGSQEKLDEDKEERVLALMDRHRNNLREEIKGLSVEEQVSVESNLEATLRAHENVFAGLNRPELQDKIQQKIAVAVKSRKDTEERLSLATSVNLRESALKQKDVAERSIDSIELNDRGEDRLALQTQGQLDLAKQAIEEGDLDIEAGSYAKAITQYQRAQRIVSEARAELDLGNRYALGPKEISREQIQALEEKTELAPRVALSVEVEPEEVVEEQIDIYKYFENKIQRISGGNTQEIYLGNFPSLKIEDFNNITLAPGDAIGLEGHTTLLLNIATRLGIELSGPEGVDLILERISLEERLDVMLEL